MLENERKDNIQFNFSWSALRLLGKSLYSNAWTAVSELVANGFDAGANNVYVLIDAIEKGKATIEIIDDGTGMSFEVVKDVYAQVGYDRRSKFSHPAVPADCVFGRKGIGKLAALYLSDCFYIQTKTKTDIGTWCLEYDEGVDPDQKPELLGKDNSSVVALSPIWNEIITGTLIQMRDVNLNGFGEASFEALSSKLANHFLLSQMRKKRIRCCIRQFKADTIEFKDVERRVAFNNLAEIAYFYDNPSDIPDEILDIKKSEKTVRIPLKDKDDRAYDYRVKVDDLNNYVDKDHLLVGTYRVNKDLVDARYANSLDEDDGEVKIPYKMTGWVGFHSTINSDEAHENDERFTKNKFYNPAKIRLYVRGKLAAENVLDTLGLTAAFVNYIEGDISFDLLDSDYLPDIATSSRQGFDELDERWKLLKSILRPIVRNLINHRSDLTKKINSERNKADRAKASKAKKEAVNNIRGQLDAMSTINSSNKTHLLRLYESQLIGNEDVSAKERYTVFLSHQSSDKPLSDFIYEVLKKRGARDTDFFYTSARDNTNRYIDIEPLETQIKKSITDENTLIAYTIGPSFRGSEYCLFEAGAGWATRSVEDYQIVAIQHKDIPEYLTNGKVEKCLGDTLELTQENYIRIATFLNVLIDHINKGRRVAGEREIDSFAIPSFPDKVEMEREGKTEKDYMDQDISDYWRSYISAQDGGYAKQIRETRKKIEEKKIENNQGEGDETNSQTVSQPQQKCPLMTSG